MYRKLAVCLVALVIIACGAGSPTGPARTSAPSVTPAEVVPVSVSGSAAGPVAAQNAQPVMVLKTQPQIVNGVINTKGRVHFNLCKSSDPDQVILPDGAQDPSGDTLNWQFHFGDSGTPAFNGDGTFNADYERFCRVDHTYEKGRYTATVSVTDKHLEDQSGEVSTLARVTRTVVIVVSGGQEIVAGPGTALSTTFVGDVHCGNCGVVFDLAPKQAMTITGFDVHLNSVAGTSVQMDVYYRVGTSAGHVSNAGAWTLLGSGLVVSAGRNRPSPLSVGGLSLAAGQVYGLCVYPHVRYLQLFSFGGPTHFENRELALTTNGVTFGPFTNHFPPFQWNGTVHYSVR